MLREMYEKAVTFHGHACPGLAIGVRAAAEARELLGVTDIHARGLCCVAESRACYQDGLQVVFGCTVGNGNLELRERGKTAFNFYDTTRGESVRLCLRPTPEGLHGEALTEFLLTAPLERVFSVTEAHFPPPQRTAARKGRRVCPRCGEPFLRVVDGEILCLDCAEQ